MSDWIMHNWIKIKILLAWRDHSPPPPLPPPKVAALGPFHG
jgi:hypothetical protein